MEMVRIDEERALIHTIKKKQRKWIGHRLRLKGDLLQRTVIKEETGGEANKKKKKTGDVGSDDDR